MIRFDTNNGNENIVWNFLINIMVRYAGENNINTLSDIIISIKRLDDCCHVGIKSCAISINGAP